MNNLTKIICVSVMLSGSALADIVPGVVGDINLTQIKQGEKKLKVGDTIVISDEKNQKAVALEVTKILKDTTSVGQ